MNLLEIRPIIIIGSVALLFYLVQRIAEQFHPSNIEGHTFRYGSLPLTLVLAMAGVFVWGFLSESDSIRWLFLSLFFVVFSMFIYMFTTSITIRHGTLQYRKLFKKKIVPLDSIAKVRKEDVHDRYVIWDMQGNKYTVSQFITGAKDLTHYLIERIEKKEK